MNLHGRKMHVTQTASNGVVGKDTIFHFTQAGNVVEARYAGGRIAAGYFVGILDGDQLPFRYCQISDGNKIDGGSSQARIEQMPDGRLRLIETFAWESRAGTGENIFEEID